MGPLTRRAIHEAIDHVLDAIEADARHAAEKAPGKPRPKKRRHTPRPTPPKIEDCDPAALAKARAALAKAGLV